MAVKVGPRSGFWSSILGRQPDGLRRLLEPWSGLKVAFREPARTMCAEDVVKWQEWGKGGFVEWSRQGRSFAPATRRRPMLAFGRYYETWACEISQVDGFCHGGEARFPDLNTFVERVCPELVQEISEESLRWHLGHFAGRSLFPDAPSRPRQDSYVRHLWDSRIFLNTAADPHHFAAARYIAGRLRKKVPLVGRLQEYSLDEGIIGELRRDYEVFAIGDNRVTEIELHTEMAKIGATYLTREMPQAYAEMRAILLPRSDSRSMRVASAFKEAQVFDLGAYFDALCRRQRQGWERPSSAGRVIALEVR